MVSHASGYAAGVNIIKRLLFWLIAPIDWVRFSLFNRLEYEGREHLEGLPSSGVLFVSNHLTYYIDVLAISHALAGPRCSPFDGFRARMNVGFVAAVEALNSRGLLPRMFNYTGAVPIKRTWREGDRDVQRPVDPGDLKRINDAIRNGWLVTFPQGTTQPGAPVRKGTAHMILLHRPIVVPIVLSGFDRAFSKKGFRRIARGVELGVRFKAPIAIAPDATVERVVEIIAEAIEQTPERLQWLRRNTSNPSTLTAHEPTSM